MSGWDGTAGAGTIALPSPSSDRTGMLFDSDGVRIHYVVHGDGVPVVLLHGYVFDLESTWVDTGILELLAREWRVVALDLRGHGRSDKPHDAHAYGTEMVRDVVRLMDHLRIGRAHVVGYSMGGELALKLLELAPQRLRSLVLAGAGWVRPGDFKSRSWVEGAELLAWVKPGESISAHVWPRESDRPPAEVRAVFDRNDPAALTAVASAMASVTVPEEVLRTSPLRTLVIFGENDWIRPSAQGMEVMSGLTLEIIPGVDHGGAMASDELKRLIREFLAQVDAQTR